MIGKDYWPSNPPRQGHILKNIEGALPGLRRYFETYPYNCLEQRSSRALALHDAPGWDRLKAELPGYLDSDGLAS